VNLRARLGRAQGFKMRIVSPLLIAATVLSLAAPAWAGAKKDDKSAEQGQFVDVSPVAAPIVLHGQLINYIFVTLRLDLAPGVDPIRLRDKEPYFRDALVHIVYRHPFVKPGDYTHIDEPTLKAAMLKEAARIVGPHMISAVEIKSAEPQKVSGLPKADAPPHDRAPIP
jgi:hypothetical protein